MTAIDNWKGGVALWKRPSSHPFACPLNLHSTVVALLHFLRRLFQCLVRSGAPVYWRGSTMSSWAIMRCLSNVSYIVTSATIVLICFIICKKAFFLRERAFHARVDSVAPEKTCVYGLGKYLCSREARGWRNVCPELGGRYLFSGISGRMQPRGTEANFTIINYVLRTQRS